MNTHLDPKVTELLCARLCHDLIGPVSAVNNGVELVRDFGDGMQSEALALIGESAVKASRLLQLYRVAFGSARGADGKGLGTEEARLRALDALSSERITIQWPGEALVGDPEVSRLTVKLILNLVMLAVDILPGAGEVTVAINRGSRSRVDITATAKGTSISNELIAILSEDVSADQLTPRTVQAFLTRFLAASVGCGIEVRHGTDEVSLAVEF